MRRHRRAPRVIGVAATAVRKSVPADQAADDRTSQASQAVARLSTKRTAAPAQRTRTSGRIRTRTVRWTLCIAADGLTPLCHDESTNRMPWPHFPKSAASPSKARRVKNPLAFRHYNADEKVEGKTMRDHLRFSVVYWHTFRGTGGDPFGPGCAVRPWEDGTDSVENAQNRVRVAFEFMEKLGAPFYAFHDRDVAPEGATLAETNKNLDAVVKVLKEEQQRTGIKLLWGTANLFSNRALHARRGDQPERRRLRLRRRAGEEGLEVTKELGGAGLHVLGRPRRLPEPVEHRT